MRSRLRIWLVTAVAAVMAAVLLNAPTASAAEPMPNPSQSLTVACAGTKLYIQVQWEAYDEVSIFWKLKDNAADGKSPVLRIKAYGISASKSYDFGGGKDYAVNTKGYGGSITGRTNHWNPGAFNSINHLNVYIKNGRSTQSPNCSNTYHFFNWAMNALHNAKLKKGAPYVWGAEGPSSFDCSGLVYYSFNKIKNFGSIPVRTSHNMYRNALSDTKVGKYYYKKVSASNRKPGDLIFFDFNHDGHITHVAFYAGNGQLYDAGGQGIPVGYHNVYGSAVGYFRLLGVTG